MNHKNLKWYLFSSLFFMAGPALAENMYSRSTGYYNSTQQSYSNYNSTRYSYNINISGNSAPVNFGSGSQNISVSNYSYSSTNTYNVQNNGGNLNLGIGNRGPFQQSSSQYGGQMDWNRWQRETFGQP